MTRPGRARQRCWTLEAVPDKDDLDIGDVGLTAIREVLHTSPSGNPFFDLLEELLVPGEQRLIWREDGPGRGVEMRRAFSGLLGRFFARAYLKYYHDFTWFVPISRDPTYVNPRLRVRKIRSARVDLPDWICGGQGNNLAIAEAKGSHQKTNPTRGTLPGPIRTANTQINGVRVQQRRGRRRRGDYRWVNRSVKGWAVMSRWGIEAAAKDAYLFAQDPETSGEPFSHEEIPPIVQSLARLHTKLTLEGLGYFDLLTENHAAQPGRESRPYQTVVLHLPEEADRRFLGAVASPFGLLPLSVSESQALISSLPSPSAVRFFS